MSSAFRTCPVCQRLTLNTKCDHPNCPTNQPLGGEVGTGAGEGATGQDTGTAWVTRSEDCPEAPAQAHLSAALEVLADLSSRSTDGRLSDAIAIVRSALWDEVEAL